MKEIRDTLSLYTYNNNYTHVVVGLFIFKMPNDCFSFPNHKTEEEYFDILIIFFPSSFIS